MAGDNPSSGDDQQETTPSASLDPRWIVGFVDGEGCFSVSIHRNELAVRSHGWQLHPVFHVYQHVRYRGVLEELINVFGCGRVRLKGPNSSVATYAVDSLRSLEAAVLPFFERHPLVIKDRDFRTFAGIVRAMIRKEHFDPEGFNRLVRLAYSMNEDGKQRSRPMDEVIVGSSETARQAPHGVVPER
jgi:hypothetical protein